VVCGLRDEEKNNMDKMIPISLAIAVCLGTTALLASIERKPEPMRTEDARLANDGPFRDGLFVGKLAAERGQAMRPPVGRWSSERDRAAFAAGFSRGYGELLTVR
jgi:hypothetical protein